MGLVADILTWEMILDCSEGCLMICMGSRIWVMSRRLPLLIQCVVYMLRFPQLNYLHLAEARPKDIPNRVISSPSPSRSAISSVPTK